MFKQFTLALSAALLLAASALAGPLAQAGLPAGTNWFLHVNLELMRTTAVGKRMMAESIGEAFEEVEAELDLRFTHHFTGLTVYGGSLPPNQGALVAHGVLGPQIQDQLVAFLSRANTFYEAEHAGFPYFAVDGLDGEEKDSRFGHADFDDLMYVAFGADQTLFTQSLDLVRGFLDNGGYLAGLSAADPRALLVLEADRAMLQGGVNTGAHMGEKWDSSVFSNVDRIAAVLTEEHGALGIHAEIRAHSPEMAEAVSNIMQGLIALKALENDADPAVTQLIQSTSIRTDGAEITIDALVEESLVNQIID